MFFQAGGDIVFNPFDKPVVPCPAHPTERLEYFCKSCDIPVCKDCVDSGHPKAAHEVATIIEVCNNPWLTKVANLSWIMAPK